MIKTITLTPGEVNCIDFDQQYPYYYIKNFSASDIYASVKKFIFVADEEEVTRIPAGSTGIVYSTLASEYVNMLCHESAKIEVIGAFERDINFTSASGGGSTGMADTYSKSELNTMLSEKVDKVEGKDLSTNDYTDEEKEKLSAITNPIKLKGKVDTVDTLPADATVGDLYFVGTDTSENYEEYVFTEDSKWEQIGTSQIDLSAYVLKEDGKGLSSNDYTDEEKTKLTSLENYTLASTSQSGLMSAADKTKLDGLIDTTPTKVTIENPNTDCYDNWNEKYCWYIKSGNVVTLSLYFKFKDVSGTATWIDIPSEIAGIEGFSLSCEISTPNDDNGVQRYTYKQGKVMFLSGDTLVASDVAVDDIICIYGTYIVL